MDPTLGRIVHYRLTAGDALATNKRREDASQQRDQMQRTRPGFQAHIGNAVSAGETVAMIVTWVVAPGSVNGKAFLDGTDTLWVTSAPEGDEPGQWSWPPRD